MAKPSTKSAPASKLSVPNTKRPYVKQSDVPSTSVDDALRVPQAILDHYAGKPTTPLFVAKALSIDPTGSQFKVLTGAAIAFGLIEGGAQAATISATELSRQILRPTLEGSEIQSKRSAVLKPKIFGDFLRNYDGNSFPRPDIAINVLEGMGVPRLKAQEVLERIEASAESVGFIQHINGKKYVALVTNAASDDPLQSVNIRETDEPKKSNDPSPNQQTPLAENENAIRAEKRRTTLANAIIDDERRRRVFITHGKKRDLVDPIKKLLEFGELVPVVSVERQSVSKPVPEKVMDDMRTCGAAIIHIDVEKTIIDKSNEEHVVLNPNVLIEIGAAMAFYGRRFILLVRDGVKLPSNLQGLYEVRYDNDTLDANSTIKLLEAIKDIKNYALPTDEQSMEY